MKQMLFLLVAVAILGLGVEPSFAQPVRAFVSGQGSDANPCSLAAPCRSFQQAHSGFPGNCINVNPSANLDAELRRVS